MTPDTGRCSSCNAEIYWTVSTNGSRMPVDFTPTEDGNVILNVNPRTGELKSTVLKRDTPRVAGRNYYTSHFATCPQARQHRKKR